MTFAYIGKFNRIYDEQGIAITLERLGHTVYRFDEDPLDIDDVKEIVSLKPDIVLFAKLRTEINVRWQLLDACRKNKITTICWVPDLYFGLGREVLIKSFDVIFRADYVFTPDGGHDHEWKTAGINHHTLRQGIFADECVYGDAENKASFDIIFVGSKNPEFPYRRELMQRLQDKYGDSFVWFGKEYTHEYRGKALADLIASTKIVIGDSVYSPRYWSNRIYETLGRGGFSIHPRIPGMEEEFTYYQDFVPYDYGDFDMLFDKIDYYRTHDSERMSIAEHGFHTVSKNYTLTQRCQELLKLVS